MNMAASAISHRGDESTAESIDREVQHMTRGATPRVLWDQRVPMRDGVELSADIYLPSEGDGPWPAILHRTPYDNTMALLQSTAIYFARRGYAAVIQDVRGRCDSDGIWQPYVNEG